jgi:hypothetical protein
MSLKISKSQFYFYLEILKIQVSRVRKPRKNMRSEQNLGKYSAFVLKYFTFQHLHPADLYRLLSRETRYDALRVCIGEELCQSLANLRLFMVGCADDIICSRFLKN